MPVAAPGPEWSLNRSAEGPEEVVPLSDPDTLFSLIDDGGRTLRPVPVHFLPCDCVVRVDQTTEIRRLIQQVRAKLAGPERERQ